MKNNNLNQRFLSLQIAWKELLHNGVSSTLIVLVIAAICLPLLILTSLKEGYLEILKDNFYKSNQATRIDILATSDLLDEQKITEGRIDTFSQITGVKAVVPSRSHKVYTFGEGGDGDEEMFDAITTVPNDPDLERFGLEGQFGQAEVDAIKTVILHKEDLKKLGYDSIPEFLPILLKRSSRAMRSQEFIIDCKVVGTVSGGLRNKIYVPVTFDREIERFQLGLSAPSLELPADPSSEETLPFPSYPYCMLMSRQPLYDEERDGVEIGTSNYTIESLDKDTLLISSIFFYKIKKNGADTLIKEKDRQLIRSYFSADDVQVIPAVKPLTMAIGGTIFELQPSAILKDDMRHTHFLESGRWLNPERDRFEIVVPATLQSVIPSLPYDFQQKIGNDTVHFVAQGFSNQNAGFMDFAVLARLNQLKAGNIKLGRNSQYFETSEANPYVNRYLMAGIHAESIEEVLPLINHFRDERNYEIHGSSEAKVKSIQQYTRLLNNFTLLISIAGILAGITALWVLMYEAIKRKKNQIGIMRAMGLPKDFITRIYLWQSLAYGLGGFFLSFIIFKSLIAIFLESAVGRTLLDIQNIEGSVFITPFYLVLYFIIGIFIVSLVAGRSAAQSVRNIDPADILAD